MPRPPNYSQERKDRDRAKAAKKAEKLAAKVENRKRKPDGDENVSANEPADDAATEE